MKRVTLLCALSVFSLPWAFSQCASFGPNLVNCGDFQCGTPYSTFYTDYPGPPASPLPAAALNPENTFVIAENPNLYHAAFACPCTTANATLPTGCDCAFADRYCPPGDNQLIVNGSSTPQVVWEQTITGLNTGSFYQFNALVDNVLPGSYTLTDPLVRVLVNGVPLSADLNVPECPEVPQNWQCGFEATTTSITLTIINLSVDPSGNDFAIDDIQLRECLDVGVTITGCDISLPLPVDMLAFTAQYQHSSASVLLNLDTYGETGVMAYELEHLHNGVWTPLTTLTAQHKQTDNQYSFQHTEPVGYNRYRVSALDADGARSSWYHAEATGPASSTPFRLVPNPARGALVVEYAQHLEYAIWNLQGQVVQTGTTNQPANIQQLPAGLYTVVLPNGTQQRLVVQAP